MSTKQTVFKVTEGPKLSTFMARVVSANLVRFAFSLTGENIGGRVAEWSKVLLEREKNEKQKKIPGLPPPGLGKLL